MKANKYTKETILNIGIQERSNFDKFEVGNRISVSQKIKEGEKERLQIFEGDVIAIHNKGIATTFTVRRIGANAISIERIFPYYSPLVESVKFVRTGQVRRAKLYYLRDRIGKAAEIKEHVLTKEQKALRAKEKLNK